MKLNNRPISWILGCLVLLTGAEGIQRALSKINESIPEMDLNNCLVPKKYYSSYQVVSFVQLDLFPFYSSGYSSPPCTQLFNSITSFHDKMKTLGIDFHLKDRLSIFKSLCAPKCMANVMSLAPPMCGPRRDPVYYSMSPFTQEEAAYRIKCDTLNLPVASAVEKSLPVHVVLKSSETVEANPEEVGPMMEYIGQLNVESLSISAYSDSPVWFDMVIQATKNTVHSVNVVWVLDVEWANRVFKTLRENFILKSLFLRSTMTLEFNPLKDPLALQILHIHEPKDGGTGGFPTWIGEAENLEALTINEFALHSAEDLRAILEKKPKLEYLVTQSVVVGNIAAPFLPDSKRMVFLELYCGHIKSIETGAFDHMTDLAYLNLGSNEFTVLDPGVTSKLKLSIFQLDSPTNEGRALRRTYPGTTHYQRRSTVQKDGSHYSFGFCVTDNPDFLDITSNFSSLTSKHLEGSRNTLISLELAGRPGLPSRELFRSLPSLQYLNLENTGMTDLDDLYGAELCDLRALRLTYNDLSGLKWTGDKVPDLSLTIPNLRWLYLDNCKLDGVDPLLMPLLRNHPDLLAASEFLMKDTNPMFESSCERFIWEKYMYREGSVDVFKRTHPECAARVDEAMGELDEITAGIRNTDPICVKTSEATDLAIHSLLTVLVWCLIAMIL